MAATLRPGPAGANLARGTTLALALIGAAAAPAAAERFRVDIGAGIIHSDYDLSIETNAGNLDIDAESNSGLGGAGPLYSAGFWVDRVRWRDLSLGVEYLRGRTDSDLRLGASGFNARAELDADLELKTQNLFLNAAWRRNEGGLHPYLGGGLGASWLDGRIGTRVRTDFLGGRETNLVEFDEDVFAPSVQFFAGLDYDLGERFYVGLTGRYFLIDGRIFEQDQVIRELSAQAKLGIRF